MVRWAFDTLEIEITKDKKQIKKAYALLVKSCHPEEYPEEWEKIHEAYETAMQYAQGLLPEPKEDLWIEDQEEYSGDVEAQDGYDEMFQQARDEWAASQSEKVQALSVRLRELFSLPRGRAYREWQHFFSSEFLPDVGLAEMEILCEALYENDLPPKVSKLVAATMEKRKELYQYSMELEKAALAESMIGCEGLTAFPGGRTGRKPKIKTILRKLAMGAAAAVFLFVILVAVTAKDGITEGKISDAVLKHLSEKYPEEDYSEEELEIESQNLYGENAENLVSYRVISTKGSYSAFAYVIGEKEGEDYTCFDNLQESEIRQAFQDSINEKTGYPEGKLFWNSEGGAFGCVEDGYFHEKYEGDLDGFFQMETRAREAVSGGDYSPDSSVLIGKNGAADYYIPDREAETIEQRLKSAGYTEDPALKDTLDQCAATYEMQLRGNVLPKILFEERTKRIEWGDYGTYVVQALDSPFGISPPMTFLMTSGWYVNVPSGAEEYLKIENGLYVENPVRMADGIYGVRRSINDSFESLSESPSSLAGCMTETETPDSLDLSENKRKRAVSFTLAEGYELPEDYCLAINKKAYGIPETGYKVMLTEYREDGENITEMKPYAYSDPFGHVQYEDALDGEGYLFVQYQKTWEGNRPDVLTICPQ